MAVILSRPRTGHEIETDRIRMQEKLQRVKTKRPWPLSRG